jgi:enamine deaminase RidA (YjgF/YER057c/UK114 family)
MPANGLPLEATMRTATSIAVTLAIAVGLGACSAPIVPGKRVFATDAVSPALGPYSQRVEANGTLYIAGTIALDREGKALVGTTIEEQTRVVPEYIGAKLRARGLDYTDVVSCPRDIWDTTPEPI